MCIFSSLAYTTTFELNHELLEEMRTSITPYTLHMAYWCHWAVLRVAGKAVMQQCCTWWLGGILQGGKGANNPLPVSLFPLSAMRGPSCLTTGEAQPIQV